MKRFTAIFVLCLITLNLIGFYAYFAVRMYEIHHEMRSALASLPAEQLEVITMKETTMKANWVEEMEMEWDGKMFDIARIEQEGEMVKIYCLHDEAEDNLISFLDSVLRDMARDESETPPVFLSFIDLDFEITETLQKPSALIVGRRWTSYLQVSYLFDLGVATPPPWI